MATGVERDGWDDHKENLLSAGTARQQKPELAVARRCVGFHAVAEGRHPE